MVQQASGGAALFGFIILALCIYLLGRFFRFLYYRSKRKKQAKAIKYLMLAMLCREITSDRITSVIKNSHRSFPELISLLRSLQIITESLEMALSSANPKTAKSRMELVDKTYARIREDDSHLLSSDEWQQIDTIIQEARAKFDVLYRLNAVRRLLEKAEGLKREGSKQKYYQEAAGLLREVLAIGGIEQEAVKAALAMIPNETS